MDPMTRYRVLRMAGIEVRASDHWKLQPRDPGGEGGGQWIKSPVGAVLDKAMEAIVDLIGSVDRSEQEQAGLPGSENQFGLPVGVIRKYTAGDCSLLASAVRQLTGYRLAVLTDNDGETGHVITRLPDGRYFDVGGIHERESFQLGEPGRYVDLLNKSESGLEELGWNLRPGLEAARLATVLLIAAGIDLDRETVGSVHEKAAARELDDFSEAVAIGESAAEQFEELQRRVRDRLEQVQL